MLLDRSYKALIFDELEDYEEAIETLTAAILSDPNNFIALNNRGVAYSEIGRQQEALADLIAATQLANDGDPIPSQNLERLKSRGNT